MIAQRHNRDKRPKDFLSTNLCLSWYKILKWYAPHWPVEVESWYLKQAFGLGDFRVQPFEAIQKWYAVVFLVLAFPEWRRHELRQQGLILQSVSEVIQVHLEIARTSAPDPRMPGSASEGVGRESR